jgi:hypothetical protein
MTAFARPGWWDGLGAITPPADGPGKPVDDCRPLVAARAADERPGNWLASSDARAILPTPTPHSLKKCRRVRFSSGVGVVGVMGASSSYVGRSLAKHGGAAGRS